MSLRLPIALALTVAALIGASAQADTYVSSTGTDTGTCPATAPCATILKGAQQAGVGGTVQVLPGLYGAQIFNGFQSTATSSAPYTTVQLQADATVPSIEIRGTHNVVFDGSQRQARIGSWNMQRGPAGWTQRITIRDLDLGGITEQNNVTDLLVDHSQLVQGCGVGILAPARTTTTDRSYRTTVQYTEFSGCKDAMQVGDIQDLNVISNWCHDVKAPATDPTYHSDCFQITGGVTNARLEENTCQNIEDQCLIAQGWTPALPRPTGPLTILRNKLTKGPLGPNNAVMLNGVDNATITQNIACGITNGVALESMQGHPTTNAVGRENLVSFFRPATGQTYDWDDTNRVVAC